MAISVFKTSISEVENKISDTSSLVENKIPDHVKYITTP